jgi:RNA polymerase sigma-70 factor (ECF subfamily)
VETGQLIIAHARQAALGDQDSTQELLKITSKRLFSYILRLTLDYSQAKELTKEVQNQIALSIWRLKKAQHFWSWAYLQTWEIVRENYLDTRKHESLFLSEEEKDFFDKQLMSAKIKDDPYYQKQDTGQLFKAIYQAMKKMSLIQRHITILRCFENMSYYEISQQMDRSETNLKVLLFRAKQKIKWQLWSQKYRPWKTFLPSLRLFGAVTSLDSSVCTPSIVIVEKTSIQVGFIPWLIGTLTSKAGIAFSTVTSAALIWLAVIHALFLAVVCLLLLPFIIAILFSMIFVE